MPSTSPKPDSNDTAMEAIHTLETLLEVFPEDISSLESLTAA